MQIVEAVQHSSIFALLTILVGIAPLGMAITYAVRPTERRLALMRPISLAAIFAALSGVVSGLINILHGIGATSELTAQSFQLIAVGLSEALIPIFVGFGCLTAAWLLVVLGMRRASLTS